jgi:predicted transcriptional regulator
MSKEEVSQVLTRHSYQTANQVLLKLHSRKITIGKQSVDKNLLRLFRSGMVERRLRSSRCCRPCNRVYEYQLI